MLINVICVPIEINHHICNMAFYSQVNGLFQLPVVCVGILEATMCESFLKALGGHAVYDATIGVMNIIVIILAARDDDGKIKQEKKT